VHIVDERNHPKDPNDPAVHVEMAGSAGWPQQGM